MASTALTLALSPEQGLQRYLSEIRKFPMLAKEDEFMLAKRWQEHGDTQAAHKLVTSHLRLVAKIAMGYRGYGLPIGEVISEGNVGLMQAVKKFDPDKGFRLATYAMWWIRASIQEYILRSWSLVKMGTTAAQKKLFFNLRRMKGEMAALEEGDLQPEHVATIAHKLAVTEDEVISMNRRLSGGGDASLNAPIGGAAAKATASGWIGSPTIKPKARRKPRLADSEEFGARMTLLQEAMGELNERERHIIQERRLKDEPATLGRALRAIRRQPRARAPDRSARVREAAEGDEEASRLARPARRRGRLTIRPALRLSAFGAGVSAPALPRRTFFGVVAFDRRANSAMVSMR